MDGVFYLDQNFVHILEIQEIIIIQKRGYRETRMHTVQHNMKYGRERITWYISNSTISAEILWILFYTIYVIYWIGGNITGVLQWMSSVYILPKNPHKGAQVKKKV